MIRKKPVVSPTLAGTSTSQVQQSITDPWTSKVKHFRAQLAGVHQSTLRTYHELGVMVRQLETDSSYYGGHRVDELGSELCIGATTLRACRRFSESYTDAELEQAVKKDLSWYVISRLLSVPKPKRADLEDKYAARQITSTQLAQACTKASQEAKQDGTKSDKRNTIGATSFFTRFGAWSKEFTDSLSGFKCSVANVDVVKNKRACEALGQTVRQLIELRRQLDEALNAIPVATAKAAMAAANPTEPAGASITAVPSAAPVATAASAA